MVKKLFTINNTDEPIGGISLKSKIFTFSLGINTIDQIDSSLYSLRFWAPKIGFPELFEIKADQETYCELVESNYYYCYFIIPDCKGLNEITTNVLSSQSKDLIIYENLFDRVGFHSLSSSDMKRTLPNEENYQYTSKKQRNTNYLTIESYNSLKQIVLVSVKGFKNESIALICGSQAEMNETIIQSGIMQLISKESNVQLEVPYNRAYILYMTILEGYGEFTFGQKTITSNKERKEMMSFKFKKKFLEKNKLVINNRNYDLIYTFYYQTTSESEIFDKIEINNNILFNYQSDLPANFYTKIDSIKNLLIASFKFTEFAPSDQLFNIQIIGYFTDYSSIIGRKKNKDYQMKKSNPIEGYYEPSLLTATLIFTKEQLEESTFNINETYIYIEITKKEMTGTLEFFSVFCSIHSSNNDQDKSYPNEYILGSLHKAQKNPNVYLIEKTKNVKYLLQLQVSINSENIDFAYLDKDETELTKNSTSLTIKNSTNIYGKTTLIFDLQNSTKLIKLSFFPKNNRPITENVIFYTFKYIESPTIYEYAVTNSSLDVQKKMIGNKTTIEVKVNDLFKRKGYIGYGIYYLKIFSNETRAFTKSIINPKDYYSVYSYYLHITNKEVKYTLSNLSPGTYILSVIALVDSNMNLYSYDPLEVTIEPPVPIEPVDPEEEKKSTFPLWLIIVICIISLIVLVTISFFVVKYVKKRKAPKEISESMVSNSFTGNEMRMSNGTIYAIN